MEEMKERRSKKGEMEKEGGGDHVDVGPEVSDWEERKIVRARKLLFFESTSPPETDDKSGCGYLLLSLFVLVYCLYCRLSLFLVCL